MNFEEKREIETKFHKMCAEVREAKGKDYMTEGEPFRDIREVADELGVSPQKVLWVHFRKHYNAIRRYTKQGQTESEPIAGRLVDAVNYITMMNTLIEEENLRKANATHGA